MLPRFQQRDDHRPAHVRRRQHRHHVHARIGGQVLEALVPHGHVVPGGLLRQSRRLHITERHDLAEPVERLGAPVAAQVILGDAPASQQADAVPCHVLPPSSPRVPGITAPNDAAGPLYPLHSWCAKSCTQLQLRGLGASLAAAAHRRPLPAVENVREARLDQTWRPIAARRAES
jgi:hypothetical protein